MRQSVHDPGCVIATKRYRPSLCSGVTRGQRLRGTVGIDAVH